MILNRRVKRKFFIAAVSIITLVLSCSKVVNKDMYVSFFKGSVTIQRGGAFIPVEYKGKVLDGDIVSVGDKSTLILQGGDGLLIRFEPNTDAVILSVNNIKDREISLNKGKVLSSVEKLQKSNRYSVKTPTVVASVRGTQFMTQYDGKNSVVAVGKGVVSVKRMEDVGNEKSVEKGNSAIAESGREPLTIRSMNIVEELELSKLDKTPVVENLDLKTNDEIKEIFRETDKNDELVNQKIKEESGLSPSEMKAKYGRVDVITLYNGKVIQGIILSRGVSYRILTTAGVTTINAKDIRNTEMK